MPVKTFESPYTFACAQHALSGAEGNLLIDAGAFDDGIRRYLQSIGGVQAILLTHGHFDHIQALDALHAAYPEAPIYLHPADMPMLRDAALNCSGLVDGGVVVEAPVLPLTEGQHTIAGHRLEVLHSPGHSPGSCMFWLPEDEALFTGDTIIGCSVGRTDLPGSNSKQLLASLEDFMTRAFPEDTQVYSGHGDPLSYRQMMECNHFLRRR